MFKSSRALPVGTIHTGKNGVKYIKTPSGKWRRKYDNESMGLKVSVAAIKRQVNKAQTTRELMNIVLEHRDRFSDAQGHPFPFIQELSTYVAAHGEKIEGAESANFKNPLKIVSPKKIKPVKENRALGKWEREGWTLEFPEKLSKIIEYNSVKDIAVSKDCLSAIKKAGFHDVDHFAQKVNDWVRSNRVISKFYLSDVLKEWVDEPVMKNQMETGTSRGILDEHSRDDWESKIVGTPINTITMAPRERPVYGIVGKHDQGPAGEYGSSSIIFKDSVRERTTYTIGNSSSEQGAFQGDVRAMFNKGRPVDYDYIPVFLLETKQVLKYVRTYMEAQIWGSADLTQDAEKIVIGDDDIDHIKQNEALWNKFKAKMAIAGVAIEDTKGNLL
jgi:hypothetical protein